MPYERPWEVHSPKTLKVAVYARYSSDMQRLTSIEDQIRECREAAERKGWIVLEQYIFADEAVSGETTAGREALDRLMQAAQSKPRAFDGIVCDDTSRFGRNLSDTLPMSDVLRYADVFLYFVSKQLDSRDPNFRSLFIESGRQDEQHNRGLAEKVHRGQRGRVLKGYIGSGRVYGYKNVPIEDPNRKGAYGRPYVESVKLEVNPEEANVIVRIFETYLGGLGTRAIASQLNKEGIPSPLQGNSKKRRRWNACSIAGIVRNEKYHGVHVWNKTKVVYNPTTKRKQQQPRDESEWERVDVPAWRIVPEELWNAVRAELLKRQSSHWEKAGGLNSSEKSRRYIFSGLMACAECGSNFNIVNSFGPEARYGCIGHRYRGTCGNKMTILRRSLEEQLLYALGKNLLHPSVREGLFEDFRKQVMTAWELKVRKAHQVSSNSDALRERHRILVEEAGNVTRAIRRTGGSSLLDRELISIEAQLRSLEELLAVPTTVQNDKPPSDEEMREFLERKFSDFDSVLHSAPEVAKQSLKRLVGKLIMRPVQSTERPTYEVSGDIRLFATDAASAGKDDVALEGSTHRTCKQYTDWTVPFSATLNAKSSRRKQQQPSSSSPSLIPRAEVYEASELASAQSA